MIDWNKFGDILREFRDSHKAMWEYFKPFVPTSSYPAIPEVTRATEAKKELYQFINSHLDEMIGDCYEIAEDFDAGSSDDDCAYNPDLHGGYENKP